MVSTKNVSSGYNKVSITFLITELSMDAKVNLYYLQLLKQTTVLSKSGVSVNIKELNISYRKCDTLILNDFYQ